MTATDTLQRHSDVVADVVAKVPTQLIIGGAEVPASDGATFDVLDPATGGILATVASGSVDDALACVDAASAAAKSWAQTAPRKQSEILQRTYQLMVDRVDELALLITAENGKALADARGEVLYSAEFFRWYAEEAVRIRGDIQTAPGGREQDPRACTSRSGSPCWSRRGTSRPRWPPARSARRWPPAAPTVLKPASETPLTALAIAALMEEAGLPAGVVNVLPSRAVRQGRVGHAGRPAGAEALVHRIHRGRPHPAQPGRTSTSSTASMELGGNAPFVVFDDADLDAAIEGAMIAKMRNGGEACTAANRFYVAGRHRRRVQRPPGRGHGRADAWARLRRRHQRRPAGQRATRDKVAEPRRRAPSPTARRSTLGGTGPDGPGFYYPPTVLTDVASDAAILQHRDLRPGRPDRHLHRPRRRRSRSANNTEYGLVSYVYTGDLARGLRVSERIEAGMVGLNRGLVSDPAAPFGGVKESGLGREGGLEGLLAFTESKYIAVNW